MVIMAVLKPGVLAYGYYKPRVSKLPPKYQDIFIKTYFGYSRQLVYTYLSIILSIFAAIAFFTINLSFSLILIVMSMLIVTYGLFIIQFFSNNLEHLLQSLEDRVLTPDFAYDEE